MNLFKILTTAFLAFGVTSLYSEEREIKSYNLAAIVYDTDASLHGAFTCAPNYSMGSNANLNACYYPSVKYPITSSKSSEVPCVGVTQGMVESTLTIDPKTNKKRMTLTSKGKSCFGSQAAEAFSAMFNSTPGVNETYCYDMTFNKTSDGKFEFESDTYQSPGAPVPGGFYPAEESPSASMMISERLPIAESKRKAEGPIYFCADFRTIDEKEGVPKSDLICKGPGWNGGIDCNGLFATGSDLDGNLSVKQDIENTLNMNYTSTWGWSCSQEAPVGWNYYTSGTETKVGTMNEARTPINGYPRWTSGTSDSEILTTGGRNQHFCFESHANFRFQKGLKFSFRGDDDIWVFIDNRLAVDIGGLHLAAPGYVDLDSFMGAYAIQNELYDIDIYFCDRRTQMSNIHIKTNMFIEQRTGIEFIQMQEGDENTNYNEIFNICYKQSGNGNCAATLNQEQRVCGDEILARGYQITYTLTRDQTNSDPSAVLISEEQFAVYQVYLGGIDITNPTRPVINEEKLREILPNGTYYLIIRIGYESLSHKIVIENSKNQDESSASKATSSSSSKGNVSKSSSSNSGKVTSSSGNANSKSSSSKGNNKDNENTTKPSFRVKMTAPFEFEIVMDESLPSLAKRYAVMDMKGQVLTIGELNDKGAHVNVPTQGSYIVKIGLAYKRINVR